MTGTVKKIIRLHTERSFIIVVEGNGMDYFFHLKPGLQVQVTVAENDATLLTGVSYPQVPELRKKGIL